MPIATGPQGIGHKTKAVSQGHKSQRATKGHKAKPASHIYKAFIRPQKSFTEDAILRFSILTVCWIKMGYYKAFTFPIFHFPKN